MYVGIYICMLIGLEKKRNKYYKIIQIEIFSHNKKDVSVFQFKYNVA